MQTNSHIIKNAKKAHKEEAQGKEKGKKPVRLNLKRSY